MLDSLVSSWRLIAPMSVSAVASYFCPMTSGSGADIPSRPPAYIFGIVWPMLYLLLGFTWHRLRNYQYIDSLYSVTSIALGLWLVLYSCLETETGAFYLIAAILAGAIFLQSYVTGLDPVSGMLLFPYVSWLILATSLSQYGVNH